jgi:hypothetical protein
MASYTPPPVFQQPQQQFQQNISYTPAPVTTTTYAAAPAQTVSYATAPVTQAAPTVVRASAQYVSAGPATTTTYATAPTTTTVSGGTRVVSRPAAVQGNVVSDTVFKGVFQRVADTQVTLHPYFEVVDRENFQKFAQQCTEISKNESMCNYYGFTFCGNAAFCRQSYTCAEGLLAHLQNIDVVFREGLLAHGNLVRMEVHGIKDEIDKLREPMAELNPDFYELMDGAFLVKEGAGEGPMQQATVTYAADGHQTVLPLAATPQTTAASYTVQAPTQYTTTATTAPSQYTTMQVVPQQEVVYTTAAYETATVGAYENAYAPAAVPNGVLSAVGYAANVHPQDPYLIQK